MDLSQLLIATGNTKLLEASQDPQFLLKCTQNPSYLRELLAGSVAAPSQSSASQALQPTSTAAALVPRELLLQLFEEFMAKDEGKRLASSLHSFASFVQSKTSKPVEQSQ